MTLTRTSLTKHAPGMQDPDPRAARRTAAKAWHDTGAIVLLPDSIERLPWQDRELVRGIAAKIYGQRGK